MGNIEADVKLHALSKKSRAATGSKDLSVDCRWLKGPLFLSLPRESWPSESTETSIAEDDPEVKRSATICLAQTDTSIDRIFEKYSSWDKLLCAVAWILRFRHYIINRRCYMTRGILTAEEIKQAEISTIAYIQNAAFPYMFDLENTTISLKSLRRLNPYISNGLMRVGGRLSNSPVDFEIRHPIIVPKGHVARLIVRKFHRENGHVGPSHTWTLIRQKYWNISGGAEVKKEIGSCIRCQRQYTKPCTQLMGDLPSYRVTPDQPPFHSTGVDYFGPLSIKQGRSTAKRYGCLFTCLNSRAIHLELAADLSASSFLNAFKRFICRRGCPSRMLSDNGTNFVGAAKELKNAVEEIAKPSVALDKYYCSVPNATLSDLLSLRPYLAEPK